MLRILHILRHFDIKLGGAIAATAQVAASAHNDQVQCDIAGTFNPQRDGTDFFRKNYPQLKLHAFPWHFPKGNCASIGLYRWLMREAGRYDVIHSNEIFHFPFIFAGLAAAKWKKPLIVSPHNSLDPEDLKKHAAMKSYFYGPMVIRRVLSQACVLHCTAEMEADRAVTFGAVPSPQRMVIPLPVPSPLTALTTGGFRERFNVPKDNFVILFLSRLDRKKGLDQLIPAFARLARSNSKLVLAIAGEGDDALKRECQTEADRLGVSAQMRWCGFLQGQDKAAAFAESDLFALTSYYENFAIVVIEAMQAGVPVLTSTGVFISKILSDNKAAVVCNPSESEIFKNLEALICNPELRSQLIQSGRELARREFSVDAVGQKFRELYSQVARLPHAASAPSKALSTARI